MSLFGFGRRPRQPGEPPPWFSPSYAQRMTGSDWQEFYAMLVGYLLDWAKPDQLGLYDAMRQEALVGLIGGPTDGAQGAAA